MAHNGKRCHVCAWLNCVLIRSVIFIAKKRGHDVHFFVKSFGAKLMFQIFAIATWAHLIFAICSAKKKVECHQYIQCYSGELFDCCIGLST